MLPNGPKPTFNNPDPQHQTGVSYSRVHLYSGHNVAGKVRALHFALGAILKQRNANQVASTLLAGLHHELLVDRIQGMIPEALSSRVGQ